MWGKKCPLCLNPCGSVSGLFAVCRQCCNVMKYDYFVALLKYNFHMYVVQFVIYISINFYFYSKTFHEQIMYFYSTTLPGTVPSCRESTWGPHVTCYVVVLVVVTYCENLQSLFAPQICSDYFYHGFTMTFCTIDLQ